MYFVRLYIKKDFILLMIYLILKMNSLVIIESLMITQLRQIIISTNVFYAVFTLSNDQAIPT